MIERNPSVAPAAILGVSLILATFVVGWSIARTKSADDVISVTGSAQKVITSDVAKWRVSLTRSVGVDQLKEGYAQINGDLTVLRQYLKKNAVSGSGITINPVNVETLVNYNAGSAPSGYKLNQEVIVESSDVAKMTAVAQGAASLLGQGALISTTSLEYYYSKLPELRVEMLAQATEDAKLRAEQIAKSAGSHLGKIKAASQGVIQLTAVNSTDISDYGSYDTTSIDKQITAVVRASFGVK